MRRATATGSARTARLGATDGPRADDPLRQRVARRFLALRRAGVDPHYAWLGALEVWLAHAGDADLEAAQDAVLAICAEASVACDSRPAEPPRRTS